MLLTAPKTVKCFTGQDRARQFRSMKKAPVASWPDLCIKLWHTWKCPVSRQCSAWKGMGHGAGAVLPLQVNLLIGEPPFLLQLPASARLTADASPLGHLPDEAGCI